MEKPRNQTVDPFLDCVFPLLGPRLCCMYCIFKRRPRNVPLCARLEQKAVQEFHSSLGICYSAFFPPCECRFCAIFFAFRKSRGPLVAKLYLVVALQLVLESLHNIVPASSPQGGYGNVKPQGKKGFVFSSCFSFFFFFFALCAFPSQSNTCTKIKDFFARV